MQQNFTAPVRVLYIEKWSFLRSINDAIDFIQSLPDDVRLRGDWPLVEDALFRAQETSASSDLAVAENALKKALDRTGWLR